eukprot:TRINITY_DN33950_c0_g1_i1.p1 TRINITY_DN33950_c0_g1~~TRINITY_DN33950_c0_g1_i1.p1  ORF type:complete len:406 (+),score=79.73 TRINITY_DN33950_c0_g1_i1:38-1219(+)
MDVKEGQESSDKVHDEVTIGENAGATSQGSATRKEKESRIKSGGIFPQRSKNWDAAGYIIRMETQSSGADAEIQAKPRTCASEDRPDDLKLAGESPDSENKGKGVCEGPLTNVQDNGDKSNEACECPDSSGKSSQACVGQQTESLQDGGSKLKEACECPDDRDKVKEDVEDTGGKIEEPSESTKTARACEPEKVSHLERAKTTPKTSTCGDVLGIMFQIKSAPTKIGQAVLVTGLIPELGSWDPATNFSNKTLRLQTSSRFQPRWSTSSPVFLKVADDSSSTSDRKETKIENSAGVLPKELDSNTLVIDYKYVIETTYTDINGKPLSREFYWEKNRGNRSIEVPRTGGLLWIVSDGDFESDEPAQLTQYPLASFDLEAFCDTNFRERIDEYWD